uniref:Uncharacterized protein n=1 Tax=Arundo donax TaxID=35708 RepID=A0A0A9HAS0_ARUDO
MLRLCNYFSSKSNLFLGADY